MILSGKTIKAEIEGGNIGVTPLPSESQYQPASLDLCIGRKMYDPYNDSYRNNVELHPGDFRLCHTEEYIELPNDIAAFVAGRSSIGRKGIFVHVVAGWIDPGFQGEITLEMVNVSNEVHEFEEGDRVAQMVFFPLDQESEGYQGQYQGQVGPTR